MRSDYGIWSSWKRNGDNNMSFTYDELKATIQSYTQNEETSFVANLPLFIRIAEERILKNVQLTLFRKNATATMTINNQYSAAPSYF